jgi:splicing factor 3A subunit 3
MHTLLEQKRLLIEDLELVENAIIKRIKVNPEIYKPENDKLNHDILKSNKYISNSTTVLQQHEVNRLMDKYFEDRGKLIQLISDDDAELHDIKELKKPEYENGDFSSFLSLCSSTTNTEQLTKLEDLKDYEVYDMFSSCQDYNDIKKTIHNFENPSNLISNYRRQPIKKIKHKLEKAEKLNFLSSFTSDLKLNVLFTSSEKSGTQLDLKILFTEWLSLPRCKSYSPVEIPKYKVYLKDIIKRDGNIKIDSIEYMNYLQNLQTYLENYIRHAYPLISKTNSQGTLEFKHSNNFCLVCNKQFAKDTVYDIHLKGKKHINAQKRNSRILEIESNIVSILENQLQTQWQKTINELERLDLLTVRERELEKLNNIESEISGELAPLSLFYDRILRETLINAEGTLENNEDGDDEDDDQDDEKLYNPLNLPIGPDGRPMPFWLYKIKGLSHEFKCEICDNEVFRGRSAYNKHFKSSKHLDGLKKLGVVSDFINFKDLSTTKEVLQLLETIQKKKREEAQFADEAQQVEDDQGNAMSKKVYDQLKKQGLL